MFFDMLRDDQDPDVPFEGIWNGYHRYQAGGRLRSEFQRMWSTQDPICGLQKNIEEWGIATEQELKQLDKEAKAEVDAAVAEAKESPEPTTPDLWNDIYFKGTEPPIMREREREEIHEY
ncbi:hypothetical protein BJ165DRAFT_1591260 [Panaeolus papilionaceus]|nr:hypothetical protein BJ165DRAFT_1591260 [Panaeolus papilionaceus]